MDTILDMQNFHKQEPDVSWNEAFGDDDNILEMQNSHENEFITGWNEALDAEDAFRRDAIENSKILSSPTGRPSQLSQFPSYSSPHFARISQPFDFQIPDHGFMPRSTNIQNLLSCRAIVPPPTTGSRRRW